MTATPPPSPWPAPTAAEAAPPGRCVPTVSPKTSKLQAQPVEALLRTVKRWCSASQRAEHATAREEQRIKDELTDLPAGWFVLHSHDVSDSGDSIGDADLVVIGPGGVFLIHLDHQPGAHAWVNEHHVTIDGRDTDQLSEARAEARRASDHLAGACGFDVAVQTVLVLIGTAAVQTVSRPAEVHVRTQHDIRDWLCKQPTHLDVEMATAVHERLRQADLGADGPIYAVGSSTTTGI